MNIGSIQPYDRLICCNCCHERVMSALWLDAVCEEFFPDRTPKILYDSDLGRFRCSKCKAKKLVRRASGTERAMQTRPEDSTQGRQLVSAYVEQATPEELAALQYWAFQLVALRAANMSPLEKATKAIQLTIKSGAILPFISFLGSEIKRIGWDERGLPERLALSAAAAAALVFSGQGAGIAALGGAIGVPLWVVFGAGGAFAGVIVEEAKRRADEIERRRHDNSNVDANRTGPK
ncbi:MAG: hypothetical protein IPG93_09315 [Burkholderiales bacterium]|nr:hypothetical protein [Burkholderiales bacterium]